ncbi:MAG: hypothetical protein WAT88_17190, partial [Saprospiraceae bacterium]
IGVSLYLYKSASPSGPSTNHYRANQTFKVFSDQALLPGSTPYLAVIHILATCENQVYTFTIFSSIPDFQCNNQRIWKRLNLFQNG